MHVPAIIDQAETARRLPFPALIAALRAGFIAGANAPLRHRHDLADAGGTLLLMPAWRGGATMGVKIVTVFPENGKRGLNAVSSTYLLCDGQTGQHLAVIDGNELTARRTAAASALAGDYLARHDARHLLVVGSGHVASMLPGAWAAVRPIDTVTIWNIRPKGAEQLAAALRAQGFNAMAATDLQASVEVADIVSCATLAAEPLIAGRWLRPGMHLDLIGAYRPDMREADTDAIRRGRVFIDTDAALTEAGDLTQAAPIQVQGSLFTLCRGENPGRQNAGEITVFKSVGSAIEDLAAAGVVYQPPAQP